MSEGAYTVHQTPDQGYVSIGLTNSNDMNVIGNHGGWDIWILKLDNMGSIQWQKCIGGTNSDGISCDIQTTIEGGYIVCGSTTSNDGDVIGNHGASDYYLTCLDSAGNILWKKCFGGISSDGASSVKQIPDSGFIVIGTSSSNDGNVTGNHGNKDIWIIRLDKLGILQWQKCYGGSGDEEGIMIENAPNNRFVAIGYSSSSDGDLMGNHGGKDLWIIRIDSLGNLIWQKNFGGSNDDLGYSVSATIDGGFIVSGTTESIDDDVTGNHGVYDSWIIKLDSNGNIQWKKCYGGSNSEAINSIKQTSDGGFIGIGYATSNDGDVSGLHGNLADCWMIKLDNSGLLQWQKCLGGTDAEGAYHLDITNDFGYIISAGVNSNDGDISGLHGWNDFWIAKFFTDTVTSVPPSSLYPSELQLHPNPTTSKIVIENKTPIENIVIYNLLGNKVMEFQTFDPRLKELIIDVSSLANGLYILQAYNRGKILRNIFIKE